MKKSKSPGAPQPTDAPELVTVNEAATLLHRRPTTVRRLIRLGQLEARLVLHEVRVVRKSVLRLLRPRPYRPQRKPPKRARPAYGALASSAQPAEGEAAS